MKVVAGTNTHNSDKWIGYCIASIYNAVDLIVMGISKETTDRTRVVVDALKALNPTKIMVYDDDRCDLIKGGFGAIKTRLVKKCGGFGADWILNPDSDHVFYPLGDRLHKLALDCDKKKITAVKFRQYFIYSGLRTLPLDTKVNPKATQKGYSMFASFFKYTDKVHVEGEIHETVKGVGEWHFRPDFDFVHVGPMVSDWEMVEKQLRFFRIRDKETAETDWIRKNWEWKTFPKCFLDFTARKRLEYSTMANIKDVKPEGIPPIFDTYINGAHELDIEWLKAYIKKGK